MAIMNMLLTKLKYVKNSTVLLRKELYVSFGISEFQQTQRKALATTSLTTPLVRGGTDSTSDASGADHDRFAGSSSRITTTNSSLFFSRRRFESTEAQLWIDSESGREDDDHREVLDSDNVMSSEINLQGLDFPGGKVKVSSELSFLAEQTKNRVPCFRILDDNGNPISSSYFCEQVSKEIATKMYRDMATLHIMDTVLYEAQRQGRISFYLTSYGEEAINIGSAAALSIDDVIFAQYREPGVLLWRGFTLKEFVDQCFGNKDDYGKGRQMPIHYGSKMHNYFTISSPIATQLPQAAGAAYSLKMDGKCACVVAYLGDGSTSEGDFHAGMNFAAVMEAPVVFICRNNGWAISTPITDQFRSDGVVVKGHAYGIRSFRVDGNDALAVYNVTKVAREMAVREQRPILVEALTYRVSHHSTSDDSTKYRPVDEIEHWKTTRNPLTIFRKWIQGNGWWSEQDESELQVSIKKEMIQAIQKAERVEKPRLSELFKDVYDFPPSNLSEQESMLRDSIARHPKDYPSDIPV